MNNMRDFLNKVKETVERYGFRAEIVEEISVTERNENRVFETKTVKNPSVFVFAKNTDGKEVKWFEYNSNEDRYHGNNTDQWNIWLCDTRKDLTAEDLVTMFTEIEAEMRVFVDPEDWQELANVCDAYEDKKYTDMEM